MIKHFVFSLVSCFPVLGSWQFACPDSQWQLTGAGATHEHMNKIQLDTTVYASYQSPCQWSVTTHCTVHITVMTVWQSLFKSVPVRARNTVPCHACYSLVCEFTNAWNAKITRNLSPPLASGYWLVHKLLVGLTTHQPSVDRVWEHSGVQSSFALAVSMQGTNGIMAWMVSALAWLEIRSHATLATH